MRLKNARKIRGQAIHQVMSRVVEEVMSRGFATVPLTSPPHILERVRNKFGAADSGFALRETETVLLIAKKR